MTIAELLPWILLIFVILTLFLGVFVYKQGYNKQINRYFFYMTLGIALWLLSNAVLSFVSEESLLFWSRTSFLTAAIGLYLVLQFSLIFPKILVPHWKIYRAIALLVTLSIGIISMSSLLVTSAERQEGLAILTYGTLFDVFNFYLLICVVALFGIAYLSYRKTSGIAKQQVRILFGGLLLMAVYAGLTDVVGPLFGNEAIANFGPIGAVLLLSTTAYAIVAHQLFDIRIIIRRTIVYSGLLLFTLGTYSLIIFFFTSLFGGQETFQAKTFLANFIAAIFIAIGFEPLRQWLTKVTDKYLFKGEYEPQVVLGQLSTKLSSSLDLREATQSLVTIIKAQMRLNHAAVIVFRTEEKEVLIKEVTQDGYPDATMLQLPPENMLLQFAARTPQVLYTEELHRICDSTTNHSQDSIIQSCKMLLVDLDRLKIAMVIPILVAQKAIGMFIVGEKLSGDAFTKEDVEFLTIVANQTANAIEKTRFWEEDQMKSEFVSIASHELLTPTAAIKGYLSMILDDHMGQIDDTARKYLTKVADSADRLAKLVEDLLNVSRIESGRLKINKRVFSFAESVQKAVDELQINAKKKSLQLAFFPPQAALPESYADPDHVYRVLVNLIGNSIKYTNQGWVRCFVTQYNPTHLLFSISDSGVGIPPDSLSHLFEKFYRADRKEIAGIQGTGLGLYISKKIVDLMDGQMWVESTVGKGTTFYFTLPIATDVAPQQITATQTTPAETNSPSTQATPPSSPEITLPSGPAASPVVPQPALSPSAAPASSPPPPLPATSASK